MWVLFYQINSCIFLFGFIANYIIKKMPQALKYTYFQLTDTFPQLLRCAGVPGNLPPPPQIWSPRAKFPRKYGPPGGIFPRKFGPPLQTWMLNNFVRVQCIVNVSILWPLYIIQRTYANIQTISGRFWNIEGYFLSRTLGVTYRVYIQWSHSLSIPYPYVYDRAHII